MLPILVLAERSQVLLPMDATWRYDSTGTQSNEVWKMLSYDDSWWPSGQALLGYEKSEVYLEPIRTELNLEMPGSTNYVLKYYFRTSFNFPTNPAGVRLFAGALVDDAAVFYCNGVEVGRLRATGQISPDINQFHETYYEVLEFPSDYLFQGQNLLAVEVHQSGGHSSDVMFGMTLIAVWPDPVEIENGPFMEGGVLGFPTTFRVEASGSEPKFQWLRNGAPISGATNDTLVFKTTLASNAANYSVIVSNTLGTVTSSPVALSPRADNVPPALLMAFTLITNSFDLVFSESLQRATATNRSNYSVLEDGVPLLITNVLYGPARIRVRTTTDWSTSHIYTVSVHGVQDTVGNQMQGTQTTNVPVLRTLLSMTADWKYWYLPLYDDLSHHWTRLDYDDRAWFGPYPAILCSSNVSYPPPSTPILPIAQTIYLRATFVLTQWNRGFAGLRIPDVVDDAAVFYLNGTEVLRQGIGAGPVKYNTFAGGSGSSGSTPLETNYQFEASQLLRPGTNVLAAELHQSDEYYWSAAGGTVYRPDVIFGAALEGFLEPRLIGPLRVRRNGDEIVVQWQDAELELQSAEFIDGPWGTQATVGTEYRQPGSGRAKFFRLQNRWE